MPVWFGWIGEEVEGRDLLRKGGEGDEPMVDGLRLAGAGTHGDCGERKVGGGGWADEGRGSFRNSCESEVHVLAARDPIRNELRQVQVKQHPRQPTKLYLSYCSLNTRKSSILTSSIPSIPLILPRTDSKLDHDHRSNDHDHHGCHHPRTLHPTCAKDL